MDTNQHLDRFFENMWMDYCQMNPQAQNVYDSLTQAGEKVINDHIAFRTFTHSKIEIDVLSQHFIKHGYKQIGVYEFKEKKLKAKHYEHTNPNYPKVFISALDLSQMSKFVNETVNTICSEVFDTEINKESFMFSGRPWRASYDVYNKLAAESEYAAWVYAHGFRPNHFTVYINYLNQLNDIYKLNSFLKDHGFKLNAAGGEVKGSPSELLEQSSTLANEIPVNFNEGTFIIPACYYEFAKRYKMEDGHLFQGFIAKSADKIFESTFKSNT